MSISGMPDKSNLQPKLPQPAPKRLNLSKTQRRVEPIKSDSSKGKLEEIFKLSPQKQLVDLKIEAKELKDDIKTYNYETYENKTDLFITPIPEDEEGLLTSSVAKEEVEEGEGLFEEYFPELDDYLKETMLEPSEPIDQMLEEDKKRFEEIIKRDQEFVKNYQEQLPTDEDLNEVLTLIKTHDPKNENRVGSASQEEKMISKIIPEKETRGSNRYFSGKMTKEQVILELKNTPSEAIYHLSGQKSVVSFFDPKGNLKQVQINNDEPLESQLEGKVLKMPSFASPSIYDTNKLEVNEAIVRDNNGYQFVTMKTADGVTQTNYTFGSVLGNEIKLYTTLEDLKKKPYYKGEISSYEAKNILSQQKGPSLLVRKKGDDYYLHIREIDKTTGEPTYKQKLLTLKSSTLVESNSLLKLESQLGRNGRDILVQPKGMNLVSNKLHSYAKMLNQGVRTRAATLARRLFPPSTVPVSQEVPVSQVKELTFSPSKLEKGKDLVAVMGLADRDWGIMSKNSVESVLNEDVRLGSSIVWRDPNYAGFMVSKKMEDGITHQQFGSIEEYSEKAGSPGVILYPEREKSFKLLDHLNLRDKAFGILQRGKGKSLAASYLKNENDAIVWREHRFPGIIISRYTKGEIVHERILPDDMRKGKFDYSFITPEMIATEEKSLQLLDDLNLKDKDWGILKNGEDVVTPLLKNHNDAIVWRDPKFSGIIVSYKFNEDIRHDEVQTKEEYETAIIENGYSFSFISRDEDLKKNPLYVEMSVSLQVDKEDLPKIIQNHLSMDPGNKELIMKILEDFKNEEWAKEDLPLIEEQLRQLEVSKQPVSSEVLERQLQLLDELNLKDKEWGILENGEEVVTPLLDKENDAIVWRDPTFSGIVLSYKFEGEIIHANVQSKEEFDNGVKDIEFSYVLREKKSLDESFDEMLKDLEMDESGKDEHPEDLTKGK